ncbi:hypothetical protein [Micromonospora coxensis]|uniref:Hemerythrin HHE cation binding domain-containing protein n=1 Tax=Micromonospora coxensis TaxID=356852 RepID=A0A1C5J9V7_9ACTN|nr:hypothetical protein [Micromonospora coxensis]SCG67355.1 hypothetical protein GA0070614_4230 [Micromonospora coxensis]
MVTGPIQQPSVVPTAVRPPAARRPVGDLSALSRALVVPPGEPHWRERVIGQLVPVRRGFAEHVRLTEGPAGLYAELLVQAPRLHRGVRLLAREHRAIVVALADLQHAVEWPGVRAEDLRRRTDELLDALARHRQRGADLLWEAYQTDLGGET